VNAIEVINDRLHAAWQGVPSGQLPFLVQCFTLDGTNKKKRDFGFWQGANRSDTGWYREDLQHRQGRKDAFLCAS
jgi:hypothetical protein